MIFGLGSIITEAKCHSNS